MKLLESLGPIEVLGLTVYGESRGEPIEGQVAVGSIIRNRLMSSAFKDNDTYNQVCLKEHQFSCWNENDPNRQLLIEAAEKLIHGWTPDNQFMRQCFWVAQGVFDGAIKDNTNNCHYYMTWDLFNSLRRPKWASQAINIIVIRNHTFFNVKQ